jgi:hypothetical protein
LVYLVDEEEEEFDQMPEYLEADLEEAEEVVAIVLELMQIPEAYQVAD